MTHEFLYHLTCNIHLFYLHVHGKECVGNVLEIHAYYTYLLWNYGTQESNGLF